MITNAGILAGSAAVLVALALAGQAHSEPSHMGHCPALAVGIADGSADPCSGWGHFNTNPRADLIDGDPYTGRVPIRPTLDAAKARVSRRRLSDIGLFGCKIFG
jgi:hypothetical protein